MDIKAYFKNQNDILDWCIKQHRELPKNIRFQHAGANEGKVDVNNIFNDKKDFLNFCEINTRGFFIFGENLEGNVELRKEKNKSSVTISFSDSDAVNYCQYIDNLITSFVGAEPYYVYAASDKEIYAKHYIEIKQDDGSMAAWLGRDIDKYLPGIYWKNWISKKYISNIEIPIDYILDSLNLKSTDTGKGIYFENENDFNAWKNKIDAVNKLAEKYNNIFSIQKVDVSQIKTPIDLIKLQKLWV